METLILENLLFIVVGLVGLFLGGEWLVSAASRLASSFGISPLAIGLTIVALGTSMPEALVSLAAALEGSNDISLGNVIGSNIANIGLILGITALIAPIIVHSHLIRREIPIMIAVAVLGFIFASDGEVSQPEGLILLLGFVGFNFLLWLLTRRDQQVRGQMEDFEKSAGFKATKRTNRGLEALRLVVSVVFLAFGAELLVRGASAIASSLGISDLIIGLTLVSVGTSLPELATSVAAAFKGERDIAIGNVVGSNVVNFLFVLGITAFVRPIGVAPHILQFEFPVLLIFSGALWIAVLEKDLNRWEGGMFIGVYAAFTIFLFLR